MQTKLSGRYIITDPNIYHGKPTFKGTCIFVEDVLEQVAQGKIWESIIEELKNNITKEAIAEAVQMSYHAFVETFTMNKSGTSGKNLIKYAGSIPLDDLKIMSNFIDYDCRKIDKDEW